MMSRIRITPALLACLTVLLLGFAVLVPSPAAAHAGTMHDQAAPDDMAPDAQAGAQVPCCHLDGSCSAKLAAPGPDPAVGPVLARLLRWSPDSADPGSFPAATDPPPPRL